RRARRGAARTLLAAQLALVDDVAWEHPGRARRFGALLRRAARTRHPAALHTAAYVHPAGPRRDAGLRRAARAGSAGAALELARVHVHRGDALATVRRWLRVALVVGMRADDALALDALVARAEPHLRRFDAAPATWRDRAARGEAEANLTLGYARWFGREGPSAIPRATDAFEAAAGAGSDEAALALALLVHEPAADVDFDDAAAWAARATRSGDPTAYWIAAQLEDGEPAAGPRRCATWLRRAARLGHAAAAHRLACGHRYGGFVRKDLAAARRWARVAADAGDAGGMALLARLLTDGAPRGDRRRREAVAWLRRAAELGNFDDRTNLGVRLHEGDGVRRDDREAVRWYRLAAAHGCPSATANLGRCYHRGHGVPRSPRTAARWFRRAAEVFDNAQGAACLAAMYCEGELGPPSPTRAVPWLRRAAAMGDPEALGELGVAYHDGQGVTQDHAFAARLYRAGAEAGDPWATYCLGLCHRDGEGVRRNRRVAARWLRLAVERGVPAARSALRRLVLPGRKARSPAARRSPGRREAAGS
ncbi:MAG: sel1 repeat family protein, partial [Planctomycetia bacterium]|nr:sel1 repeat family protein [Planctomycetia bacterium]